MDSVKGLARFEVPCVVADNLLQITSGDEIKVLLYILRNAGKNMTNGEISAHTGVSGEEVENAVKKWKMLNVLTDTIQAAENFQTPEFSFLPTEVYEISIENAEFREMMQSIQGNIPNTKAMSDTLVFIHRELKTDCKIIAQLVTYCKALERTTPSYIEAVAREWKETGIDTVEKAAEKVRFASEKLSGFEYQIMNIFGMKYRPTTSQREYIEKWLKAEYSLELIKYAYEITIENIEKISFPYIDRILTKWNTEKITTLEEAMNHRNLRKTGGKQQDDFNPEDYEILINNF